MTEPIIDAIDRLADDGCPHNVEPTPSPLLTALQGAICNPELGILAAHPWTTPAGTLITNNKLLVLLPERCQFPPIQGRHWKLVEGIITAPAAIGRANVADLLAWCGPHEPEGKTPCLGCNATGKVECHCCGNPDAECETCEGSGHLIDYPEPRPGYIDGGLLSCLIDCNMLAKVLPHLSGRCEVIFAPGTKCTILVLRHIVGSFVLAMAGLDSDRSTKPVTDRYRVQL